MVDHATRRTVRLQAPRLFTLVLAWGLGLAFAQAALASAPTTLVAESAGIHGGLCVQVGCQDTATATGLARTGRFLVQMLDTDSGRIAKAREAIESQGLYGLASVDRLTGATRLPYEESMVNLVVVEGRSAPPVPPDEVVRVLAPRGVLIAPKGWAGEDALKKAGLEAPRAITSDGAWLLARKPWPAAMDEWPQPRHGAGGNAVSRDTVVGPPRRIRWVTGPSHEVPQMVSAAGRNYYGGLWARDAFNSLRLWQRDLGASAGPKAAAFRYAAAGVRPIAEGELLFVSLGGTVTALNGATGEPVRNYPEAGPASELVYVAGALLTIDGKTLRAVEVDSAKLRWTYAASEPRFVVSDGQSVFLLEGSARRGEKTTATALDLASGTVRWKQSDYPWLPLVRRTVCHGGLVAFEVSTLADEKEGNAIHVVSGADGKLLWGRSFVPGMQHMKQARAMFIGDQLWVLEHLRCVALDPRTGDTERTCPAGFCHCFPPAATSRYILTGEMHQTDLATGDLAFNPITKSACGRDTGWVPANGLLNVTPKHCVCWPMLRGYAAMAAALPGTSPGGSEERLAALLQTGVEAPAASATAAAADDWPCYRHDAWRSGSTPAAVPAELKTEWTADLGARPEGPIAEDWRENPFLPGPVTPPVVAGGLVYVARGDAHQVVALDAGTGMVRWRFTANGRIDTPPTIHRGLCLFGCKSGWVYGLRADDGRLVWRLRVAPSDEQIVAYGQLESPWPVPGSVLVVDDAAYFAAGRQPLADGGIIVAAIEPSDGKVRWVRRLDTIPTKDFYGSSGLEFDNFNLLQREGDSVAMSRWLFKRATGEMTCKETEAFAVLKPGDSGVIVPRNLWGYAPRNQPRHGEKGSAQRPLAAFRDGLLLGCRNDFRTLYRRDFDLARDKPFDMKWMTGWAADENSRKRTGDAWPSDRLARDAGWSQAAFGDREPEQQVVAMVLAGDTLFVGGSRGGLTAMGLEGKLIAQSESPAPVWDGMAAAGGRLFVSTPEGKVVCLGKK